MLLGFTSLQFVPRKNLGFDVNGTSLMPVAKFLRTIPEDALVCAFPARDADNLAVLARRSMYIAREISHCLYQDYLKEIRRRTWIALAALSPVKGEPDLKPLEDEGVHYLVIRKARYREDEKAERHWKYDEPYASWLAARTQPEQRMRYAKFWEDQGARKVYENHQFIVINIL